MLADDLQRIALDHLNACMEAHLEADMEEDPHLWPESPASAPFCGCDTCMARELSWAMATELQKRGICT